MDLKADPVRPVAPRKKLKRIARTTAERIEWLEAQGGFTAENLAWAIEPAIKALAAAPVPCAASPADGMTANDEDSLARCVDPCNAKLKTTRRRAGIIPTGRAGTERSRNAEDGKG